MFVSKHLSPAELTVLCEQGKIISDHGVYGPKVILLKNGHYLKVFNPKAGLTKRKLFPKYKTFVRNTERLSRYQIPCVRVVEVYNLPEQRAYAVEYVPLDGTDLRTLAQHQPEKTLEHFLPFLVSLHERGVYFRGMHLGNVLRLENGGYGLIDVADMRFTRGPLSLLRRVRNLAHMIHNKDDAAVFKQFGIDKFLYLYVKESKLLDLRKMLFYFWVKWYL